MIRIFLVVGIILLLPITIWRNLKRQAREFVTSSTFEAFARVQGADGDLDPSFGRGGKVTTDFNGLNDGAAAMALQSDGKILVAGRANQGTNNGFDFALARYDRNGNLDSSFGRGGKVTTDFNGHNDAAFAIALQSDEKILVTGRAAYSSSGSGINYRELSRLALARYDRNGNLDPSFGSGGKVTTALDGHAMTLQSDGRIVVAGWLDQRANGGSFDFALARYDRNGNLDPSFGRNGEVTTDFNGGGDQAFAVALQNDGKILVAGDAQPSSSGSSDFALARYDSNGNLDPSFGSGGRVTTDFNGGPDEAVDIALQQDGKIVAVGFTVPFGVRGFDFALARYDNNGKLDLGFGREGKVATDFSGTAVAGFEPTEQASSVALQRDRKIVVAGMAAQGSTGGGVNFALARYDSGGNLDLSFGRDGRVTTDFNGFDDFGGTMVLQSDGEIIVAGSAAQGDTSGSNFALARYRGSTVPLTQDNTSSTIAYSSRRDGNQEIYLLDLATGRQTNLTNNVAEDGYPKWSPDGRRIAFSTNRDGNWQIYFMNRDGTQQSNLTLDPHDSGYPDWSPDGQSIVFASTRYGPKDDIFVSGADGSNLKRLTNSQAEDVHPAWSPDGRRIAFASERDGNRQIYVMNADGTNPRRLNQNIWYDDYPCWSPDGLELAFASNRDSRDSHKLDIYVINADGSNVRRVVGDPADDRHPTWSPDGKMLAFSSDRFGDRDIFIANRDGTGVRRVISTPGNDEHPNWVGATKTVNTLAPADRTASGFYWPLGNERYTGSRCGTWLGRDATHGGCYFRGLYHLGVDMMAKQGDPVYSIGDGEVIGMSTDGEGNAAAFIKHRLRDGTPFVAVYGHIRTAVNAGDKKWVKGGKQFATVGHYSGGNHLHFAVRPGIVIPPTKSAKDQNGNIMQIGWGRASNWFWPDTNGFVEPISWINPASALARNQLGMELVYVPPGSFMMGSNKRGADESPVHRVTIKEGFYMGRYEVTQAEWQQVMGSTVQQKRDPNILGVLCEGRQFPPVVGEGNSYPMYYVSWYEAQEFIRRLNERNDGFIYRLPSEAEWEYACRAGTTGDYGGNLDSIGWYEHNSGCQAHRVGTKEPNAFGLYDMHGNVREWCEDWYHDSYTGAPTDGSAWSSDGEQKYRVSRGGAWGISASYLRSASRDRLVPWGSGSDYGLRVVATKRVP